MTKRVSTFLKLQIITGSADAEARLVQQSIEFSDCATLALKARRQLA